MELAEWFDNDWEDMDIAIDRDLVVISEARRAMTVAEHDAMAGVHYWLQCPAVPGC